MAYIFDDSVIGLQFLASFIAPKFSQKINKFI